MPSQPTNAGIVTDEASGSRHIPESVRADGSTRKAIKIRPGYRPPEDVELYKNRTAEAFRERGKRIGIPGAAGAQDEKKEASENSSSAAASKNAKRREARKKAKAAEGEEGTGTANKSTTVEGAVSSDAKLEEVDPEVEKQKKVRNLKKKLKQARELQDKKEEGGQLLPEQIAKVIKISELCRELEALGVDSGPEGKPAVDESEKKAGNGKVEG